jgi:hypothetical protein
LTEADIVFEDRYFQASGTAGDASPPFVKIFVGLEHKLWVLPEQLLCDRVAFFKSAFQSDFRESKEKVPELRGGHKFRIIMGKPDSERTQGVLRAYSGCSGSDQVCSPSAQVKATATHVQRLKRN